MVTCLLSCPTSCENSCIILLPHCARILMTCTPAAAAAATAAAAAFRLGAWVPQHHAAGGPRPHWQPHPPSAGPLPPCLRLVRVASSLMRCRGSHRGSTGECKCQHLELPAVRRRLDCTRYGGTAGHQVRACRCRCNALSDNSIAPGSHYLPRRLQVAAPDMRLIQVRVVSCFCWFFNALISC
jgi:hypothetical protein